MRLNYFIVQRSGNTWQRFEENIPANTAGIILCSKLRSSKIAGFLVPNKYWLKIAQCGNLNQICPIYNSVLHKYPAQI